MTNIRKNPIKDTPQIQGFDWQKFTPLKLPPLDTLAQLDHGCIANNHETLTRRAIAKYYTNSIIMPLIDLKNEFEQSYWNSYHCVSLLQIDQDGKVTSKYCKNRWCIVCNRIRTAILINTYLPTLKQWKRKSFVTLTTDLTKTCVGELQLKEVIQQYKNAFTRVWRRLKRKYGTTNAIRKIEVTHSFRNGWYHPHFHVILEVKSDEDVFLLQEWLKEFPNADKGANDIRIADDRTVKETFKYMTKMWRKINKEDSLEEVRVLPYPPEIMHTIFKVMYKKRTIQTYGDKLKPIDEDFDTEVATVYLDTEFDAVSHWDWYQDAKNWICEATGELLV